MKSTLKKMLALLLALAMITSVFAGCDNAQPAETTAPKTDTQPSKETDPVETEPQLEPVTLNWMVFASEKEGSKDVEEAFNAKLATVLPNTTVKFIFAGSGYAQNWSMAVNGGDKIDLAWGGYATSILQDIKDGNIIALDELINTYAPHIAADWKTFSNQYTTGSYDGVQYAIPCIQPVIKTTQAMTIDEEFFEKYMDSDAFMKELRSTSKLTYKMLDIIEAGLKAAIADGHIKPGDTDYNMPNGLVFATRGYMPIGEEKYHLWYDPTAANPVVMHMYELPEVQMLIDRYAKWYDAGWFSDKEILEGISMNKVNISQTELYNAAWVGYDENGIQHNPATNKEGSRPTVKILLQTEAETWVGAANIGAEASYIVVPYTSENPERAMMLLDLLHDDVGTVGNELYNMISFGFAKDSAEHQKYGWFNYAVKKSDDGQDQVDNSARGDAPNMHSVYNWAVANTFRSLFDGANINTVAYKEYCLNYYNEVWPTLRRTAVAGMVPDTTPVINELSAMLNVEAEYGKQLGFGTAGAEGIDELYDKVMAAMAVAGLNIVKGELQDQIDDYIAKNK